MTESTGCSPLELVYGEQVRLPVDVIVGNKGKMPDATDFASAHPASSSGRQESLEESTGLPKALF